MAFPFFALARTLENDRSFLFEQIVLSLWGSAPCRNRQGPARIRIQPAMTPQSPMFKHVHRITVSNQTQCGTVWYKKVQDGTIKCRMVQDGTVQQRLKHQIVESKTKHGKLTKIIWSNFHQCRVVLGSLEQASSIFIFQVFGHLLQQTVVGSVSASCSCPSLYQNSPSIHQILADTKSYSRSQMV